MQSRVIDNDIVIRGLRMNYQAARADHVFKIIDGSASLITRSQKKPVALNDILQEAATYIQKQFRLRWVIMGLRSPTDGLCRYVSESGVRQEVWEWQRDAVYKKEDFALSKPGWFSAGEISALSRVYLEEDNPLGDDAARKGVNRPFMMKAIRKSPDDALEADFIDTLIMTPDNDLLGWIEYSGTIAGKFPDSLVIRWIEMVSAILGAAIVTHNLRVARAL